MLVFFLLLHCALNTEITSLDREFLQKYGVKRAPFSNKVKQEVTKAPEIPCTLCKDIKTKMHDFPKVTKHSQSPVPDDYFWLNYTQQFLDNITFIRNPTDLCKGDEFLVVLILSDPHEGGLREAVRATWGMVERIYKKNIKRAFFIGEKPKEVSLHTELQSESAKYNDIIQANFVDSYKNLTVKTILSLRWSMTYCPSAKYVMRTTDDVLIDFFKLIPTLDSFNPSGVYFGCPIWTPLNIHVHGKYGMWSEVKWPSGQWAPYQDGFYVVFSRDVVKDFFYLACKTPLTWPDDTYLGALANMRQLKLLGHDYDTHCIRTGPEPHYRANQEDWNHLLNMHSPVMFVHFGDRNSDPTLQMRELWRKMMRKRDLTALQ